MVGLLTPGMAHQAAAPWGDSARQVRVRSFGGFEGGGGLVLGSMPRGGYSRSGTRGGGGEQGDPELWIFACCSSQGRVCMGEG